MRAMPQEQLTTADQLLVLEEPGYRHELVRGELRRMSAAGYWHGAVVGAVAEVVGRHVSENELGCTFAAGTGFTLEQNPDTVLAPDVAFVRTDRMPPAGRGFFPGPPDLAVEVTSPNDTYTEVNEKALRWLEHGVQLVWVVELKARTVTVYRDRQHIRILGPEEVLSGEDVLPGFEVEVAKLFPLG